MSLSRQGKVVVTGIGVVALAGLVVGAWWRMTALPQGLVYQREGWTGYLVFGGFPYDVPCPPEKTCAPQSAPSGDNLVLDHGAKEGDWVGEGSRAVMFSSAVVTEDGKRFGGPIAALPGNRYSFRKAGMSFAAGDFLYVAKRDDARVEFRRDGVFLDGFSVARRPATLGADVAIVPRVKEIDTGSHGSPF
jgi:hypothetical protein